MMEIYQEQHGDEEAEEEQEVENFKRRISRPKIQFSPVPEIKKRILKKPKFKLNMSIRLNTGQTLNPFINDSSTSAYTSRENSFLDERDFVGFDRLTQRELREQLGRIKPRNFLLPHYKNLRTVLENGSDSLSDNYLNNNRFFLDSSLDEQEEIHLLEPTRVEEEDNFFGTSQHEILENSRITAGMASIATKTPTHSHGNNLLDYKATTSTSSIQLSKLQTSESSESTKRMRKPAKLTDDFVYTPLIRQKQDVPLKSPAKRVFKIKQPKVTQLTESSDVSIQEEGPGTSQKPTAVLIGSPRKKKILGRKFEPKKRLPVLPYLLGNRKKPGRPKGVKQHEFIAPTQPGTSAGNDLLMTIGKMHLGPRMSNHLFDQQVTMTSESDSSASTQKRMRKPAHLTEDFVYTPLTKQQKQDAALKLKQKALKFKQPVPPLKIKRPPPKKHFPLPDTVEQQISHPEEPMEQEKPIRKKIHFKPLVPEIPQIHLEFFERMHLRKLLNPFSIGIRRRERFAADDYFYREIFVRDDESPPHVEASEEEEIDCVGLPTQKCDQDELMTGNPADESAAAIVEALQKDMTIQPIDIETPNEAEETFEEILAERINAVEPITREFLRILFKHIKEQRHVDIVSLGLAGGASIFHSLTMKNANRLRESLKLYSKSSQQAILVAHCWLLKNIPKCFIASYLNLLRFLRAAGSSLTDHIIGPAEDEFIAEANSYIRDFVRHKIYEPPMNPTFKPIEGAPLPNVSLILVYPQISAKTCKHITRAHETLFRHLLPLVVCCVEKVELIFDIDRPLSVEECAWLAIRLIRKRVREIVKRRPNDHIFLAGWGTTCWLNHKVTMFVPGVSGLLDFAFPTESACGSRGSVDDEICLTYPSTLFIVGENAANVKMASMQNLRRNMLTDSGLIVLGAANHNLLVSQARLSVERVTQFVVQRTIVEYTVQFVKQVVADLGPSRDCRELLKPIKLPNIYEVDGTFLKAPAPTRPRKTAAEKRQQNGQNGVAKSQQQQPRTLIAPDQPSTSAAAAASAAIGVGRPSGVGYSRPTKMASHLPPHLQPVIPASSSRIPTNIYSARASFSGSLKNSQQQQHHFMAKKMSMDVPISSASTSASSTIKIPSPEELNRQFQQAASATIPSTTSTAPNIALLQETIQEEEEAAAALSLLK